MVHENKPRVKESIWQELFRAALGAKHAAALRGELFYRAAQISALGAKRKQIFCLLFWRENIYHHQGRVTNVGHRKGYPISGGTRLSFFKDKLN